MGLGRGKGACAQHHHSGVMIGIGINLVQVIMVKALEGVGAERTGKLR